jgi:arylsulfatase A-like enzyme
VPDRPNILVIMTDQHRGDALSCAWPAWRGGPSPVRTPHLDRLAAGGVRFDRAYVANPLCMPARATLLTGLPPRAHGVRTNGIDLDHRLPTLPAALARAGYATHSAGKIHVRAYETPKGVDPATLDPADHAEAKWMWEHGKVASLPSPYYGFQTADFTGGHTSWMWGDYANAVEADRPGALALLNRDRGTPPASGSEQSWRMAIPPELHYNRWIADRAIAFLERAAKGGTPFLLSASFPDPHHAFAVPDPWYSMYDRAAMPLPVRREGELDDLAPFFRTIVDGDLGHPVSGRHGRTRMPDDRLREILAITCGMVSFVDDEVGRLLGALDRLGLAEDTLVLFLADHGDLLGDHWLMNKGPFHFDGLLRVPFIVRWPGRVPAGRVTSALASQLDVVPTLCEAAGIPALEYGPPPGTAVEAARQLAPLPGRSLVPVLTGAADSVQDAVVVENDEDYLGLRLRTLVTPTHSLTAYVGADGLQPFGELFDLAADPGQVHNLWADPGARHVKSALTERLLAELVRTDSRLPRRSAHA